MLLHQLPALSRRRLLKSRPTLPAARAPNGARALTARPAPPRRRRGHFRDLSAAPSGPRSSARARRSLFASTDQSPRIQRSEPVRTAPIPDLWPREVSDLFMFLAPTRNCSTAGNMLSIL
ncbi:unnamed protein product [Rangifer tarandus platyrhynchus]|uniref:Uncharacterized protein n=1 Tax=Rangifer tarandus platyrhynchus TaxID=3082113 RepID=A0ABN8ZNC4_RANTA|nr:unnamed protein product [Rangifer tarandus platyrhynchus]